MGAFYKVQVTVKTLSGSTAEALGTGTIPAGSLIQADSGDTVYIGGSDVSSTTGFLLPTTPMKLGDILTSGFTADIDISKVYVQGANGDKVRVLAIVQV